MNYFEHALFDEEPRRHDDFFKVRYADIKGDLDRHGVRLIHGKLDQNPHITVWNGAVIEPETKFFWHLNLCTMGAYSYSHSKPVNGLSIGRYCSIASDIRVFGASHYTDWISTSSRFYEPQYVESDRPLTFEDRLRDRIIVENDVWIGSDVALARGIRIGTGAVIATGAIVTKDVPAFTVVGGIPAKPIKRRFSEAVIERIMKMKWWDYDLRDFAGLKANDPDFFLGALEEKIAAGTIAKYRPQPLRAVDLAKHAI